MKKILAILLPLVVIGQNFSFAQSVFQNLAKADSLFALENPTDNTDDEALLIYSDILTDPIINSNIAGIHVKAALRKGVLEQSFGYNQLAIKSYAQSIALAEKYKLSDSLQFAGLLYRSTLYYYQFEYEKSYQDLQTAEKILLKYPSIDEAERFYNLIGVLHFQAGDFRQCIPYFEKAIQLRSKGENGYIFSFQMNYGLALYNLQEYEKAEKIFSELYKTHREEPEVLIQLATVYIDKNEPDNAFKVLKENEDLLKNKYPDNLNYLMGQYYRSKNNYELAESYFLKAVQRQNQLSYLTSSKSLMALAELSQMKNKRKDALHYWQDAIVSLHPNFKNANILFNPKEFKDGFNSILLLRALGGKAATFKYLYHKSKNKVFLAPALDTYKVTLQLARSTAINFGNESSRLDLKRQIHTYFQEYSDLLIAIGEYEKAFEVSDKGKAEVLSLGRRELDIKTKANIPATLIRNEQNLKLAQSALIRKLEDASPADRKLIEERLTETNVALSEIQRQMLTNKKYTDEIRNKNKYNSVSEIQSRITTDDLVMAFYEGQTSNGYFLISKNDFQYLPIRNYQTIQEKTLKVWKELNAVNGRLSASSEIILHEIYNTLIGPVWDKMAYKKQLLVIPDGKLNGFPFEILKDRQNRFLIQKIAISYLFSSDFLKSNLRLNKKTALAFEPFSEKIEGYKEWYLPNSTDEFEWHGATVFRNKQASREAFLKSAGNYDILHLATHAHSDLLDPDKSFIQFYPKNKDLRDNRLYLYEITQSKLSAQMVFLSACESFGNELIPGEGIRGLSWAFSMAGSQGIISSLWKAEDHSTSFISKRFYYYISQNHSISSALRLAKLDFLESPDYAHFQSEPYWSHLVYAGYEPYHAPLFSKAQKVTIVVLIFLLFLMINYLDFLRSKILTFKSKV